MPRTSTKSTKATKPAAKKPAKVYVFFNCDEAKSKTTMNIFYNHEVFKDTKASRKALWTKVEEEVAAGRVQVDDAEAAQKAILDGEPCDASQHLHFGEIVALDCH